MAGDGGVKNFHRSARARPPPADTPDESSAVTTSQVTPSIHDFAVPWVTGRLIVDLVEGGPETNPAEDLLKTGFLVWLYTIIAFAFLLLVLDGGGPESRFLTPREFPDLAFPAQLNPGIARPGWRLEILRLPLPWLHRRHRDQPDGIATPLARWGQTGHDRAVGLLPHDSGTGDCPGSQYLAEVGASRDAVLRAGLAGPVRGFCESRRNPTIPPETPRDREQPVRHALLSTPESTTPGPTPTAGHHHHQVDG